MTLLANDADAVAHAVVSTGCVAAPAERQMGPHRPVRRAEPGGSTPIDRTRAGKLGSIVLPHIYAVDFRRWQLGAGVRPVRGWTVPDFKTLMARDCLVEGKGRAVARGGQDDPPSE
jgi:hypothetical protein